MGRSTLSPGTTVGGYTVLRTIGSGGLGVVYEARHERLDKLVAVKALKADLAADPNARERFLREGRTAAKLRHPNVIDVSDVTIDGDTPYLVMELLQGEDLASLIVREGSLSVQTTIDLLVPIASALALAHEHGIVHRDLKPQNIFLSESAFGAVIPKVVDFGISKIVDEPLSDLTRSNAFVGTPHYMSPEQARGEKQVDHRCDQFSLGVLAYECLTGWRPFTGDSLFTVLSSVINHDPPSVHTVAREVNPELAAIIMKLMAKSPEDRFENMQAVGRVLLPFASSRICMGYETEFSTGVASSAPPGGVGALRPVSHTLHSAVPLPTLGRAFLLRHRLITIGAAALAVTLGLAWAVSPGSSVRDATRSVQEQTNNIAQPLAPAMAGHASDSVGDLSTTRATSKVQLEAGSTGTSTGGEPRNDRPVIDVSSANGQHRSLPARGKLTQAMQAQGNPPRTGNSAYVPVNPKGPAESGHGPNAPTSVNTTQPERGVNGALILP